jgi:hypothetical protein
MWHPTGGAIFPRVPLSAQLPAPNRRFPSRFYARDGENGGPYLTSAQWPVQRSRKVRPPHALNVRTGSHQRLGLTPDPFLKLQQPKLLPGPAPNE